MCAVIEMCRKVCRIDIKEAISAKDESREEWIRLGIKQLQILFAMWQQCHRTVRIEAARQHLEAWELPLKVVANIAGFYDEQTMRRAFLQQLSMTPKEYRERFGAMGSHR